MKLNYKFPKPNELRTKLRFAFLPTEMRDGTSVWLHFYYEVQDYFSMTSRHKEDDLKKKSYHDRYFRWRTLGYTLDKNVSLK